MPGRLPARAQVRKVAEARQHASWLQGPCAPTSQARLGGVPPRPRRR
jgi:hypothetical protein